MIKEKGDIQIEGRFKKDDNGRLRHRSQFFMGYMLVNMSEEESVTDLASYQETHEASTSPDLEAREKEYLGDPRDFVVFDSEDEEDHEDIQDYCVGGYHPVQIGDVYNKRFEVLRKLGYGQFSTVWLCWDQKAHRFAAAKIVRALEKYAYAGRCEMELLQKISQQDPTRPGHNKLLSILGGFSFRSVNGRHLGILTEALGPNLLKSIINSPQGLPLNQVRSISKQVLQGLEALHSYGIMHTDIKPENVLFELSDKDIKDMMLKYNLSNGAVGSPVVEAGINVHQKVEVKIADFSNAFEMSKPCEGKIQTRQYRALEVIIGAKYGPPADMWSVACMIFELATGKYLFNPEKGPTYPMEDHHLALIAQTLGSIGPEIYKRGAYWQEFFEKGTSRLKFVNLSPSKTIVEHFPADWKFKDSRPLAAFIKKMLIYDTKERLTAHDALKDKWLKKER